MKFTQRQIDAFCQASHDRNPVHIDRAYSHRTPFGRPVVYGILVVLAALAAWAGGKPFRLRRLRAAFKKPMFLGEAYAFEARESKTKIHASICRGPVDYYQMQFELSDAEEPLSQGPPVEFVPLQHCVTSWDESRGMIETAYLPNESGEHSLLTELGMSVGQMPRGQLSALLWSSYWVGMIMPGRQALYSELDITFSAAQTTPGLQLTIEPASIDKRFSRITQSGHGTSISSFEIVAYVRPPAIEFDVERMRDFAGTGRELSGLRVFVTGAGRGFGAAVSAIAGLRGARVLLNYRSSPEVAQAMRAAGLDVLELPGDLSISDDCQRMAARIEEACGGIDVIVNNAYPAIHSYEFFEQGPDSWLSFVEETLRLSVNSLHYFLPLLVEGGTFIQVSTEFVQKPQKGFTHYAASKSAQEAMIRGLSLENRKYRYVLARLPRIRTDQTNIPYDPRPAAAAGSVAASLLELIKREGQPVVVNLMEVDLT